MLTRTRVETLTFARPFQLKGVGHAAQLLVTAQQSVGLIVGVGAARRLSC